MEDYGKEIGKWLAHKREQQGLSQGDVAKHLGMTKTAIHYYETGKRKLSADMFLNYCLVLNVDPSECIRDVMHEGK